MRKRILSLFLAVLLVVTTLPVPTRAADTKTDYSGDIGKYAVLNEAVTDIAVLDRDNFNIISTFWHDDFAEGTILEIADWYLDADGKRLWYLVEFYSGGVAGQFADGWPANAWVDADALLFVDCCEGCGKPDCTTTHTWCESCQKYDCGVDHTVTEPTDPQPTDPTDPEPTDPTTPSDPDTPEVPEISATVKDANGNVMTDSNGKPIEITVSGDALPEGAELVVVTPYEDTDHMFIYDVFVYCQGNVWQPDTGASVTMRLPVPNVADGHYVEIIHFLEQEEQIFAAIEAGNVFVDDTVALTFPAAEAAYAKLIGENNAAAFEVFELQVKDGIVEIPVTSFSIYTWNGSSFSKTSTGDSEKIVFNSTATTDSMAGNTYYVTAGHVIFCDRGGTAASSRQWRYSSGAPLTANNELEGAHGAEIKFTVDPKTATGTTFYIENRIYWWGWKEWKRVNFVVVEGRTINFYNGSTHHASDTVITNGGTIRDSISWPSTPQKSGCNFVGWSTTSGGTSTINTGSWYPTALTTNLYAVYNYNVQYNLNGGSGISTTQTAYDNANVTLHKAPTRSGYTFLGWYSSADGEIYNAESAYSQRKNTTMTALWGKTDANGSWNHKFYVLPGTATFSEHLKVIDGTTKANPSSTVAKPNIVADSNIYYVAPGATMTFERSGGSWRIDAGETGITTSVGNFWTTANTITVTVSASASPGTVMMLYSRSTTGTTVNCARIEVKAKEDLTTMAINDTQNIYRVGLYILNDSTKIPGEPNYTTGIQMINVNGGMNYSSTAQGVVSTSIASSANYIPSLDGSCTMGVVDYTGRGTIPYMDEGALDAAMERVITALAAGTAMTAADGVDLTALYKEKGADYIRANYAVRPHIVKLMTGLSYVELGWHIDCSIYPQQTVTLTYNLNPPVDYVLKSLGTPPPGVYTGDLEASPASFTVSSNIKVGDVVTASVSGSSDTAILTFVGWNTEPDGTGQSYAPGSSIKTTESITLYAQWTGGKFTTGTLEIYKKVTVAANSQSPSASDTFTFSINLSGNRAYSIYNTASGALVSSGTMTNGTFTLKAGQFIRFTQIPVATYTVTESNLPANYTVSAASQSVALKGGYVNQVSYTNTYTKLFAYAVTGFINNGGAVTNASQTVTHGQASKAMTFTPATGYKITGITVNGVAQTVTSESSYTYPAQTNVTKKIEIVVTTALKTYVVAGSINNGGSVSNNNQTVNYGANSQTMTFTPQTGYKITGVTVTANGTTTSVPFDNEDSFTYTATNVTGPVTVTVTTAIKTFTVVWKNYDGTVLETDTNVPYGSTPTYNGATPEKPKTEAVSYNWTGWTPSVSVVTANVEYTATFGEAARIYYVTLNPNGADAGKEGTSGYYYRFKTTVKDAAGNLIYYYTDAQCKVPMIRNEGEQNQYYNIEIPQRTGYRFAGYFEDKDVWQKQFVLANGETCNNIWDTNAYDTELFARWIAQYAYTLTFDANTTDAVSGMPNNASVGWVDANTYTFGWTQTPTRAGYAFKGWSTNPNATSGSVDMRYTLSGKAADTAGQTLYAVWVRTYTVTGTIDVNGTITGAAVQTVEHGKQNNVITFKPNVGYKISSVTVNGESVTNFSETEYSFRQVITEDTTVVVTTQRNIFTIQWWVDANGDGEVDDGEILKEETLPYGTVPCYNGTPTLDSTVQYDYNFAEWQDEDGNVLTDATQLTADVVYKAVFTETIRSYQVTWVDGNGNTLKTDTVQYGVAPVYSGATPTKLATAQYSYTFANAWSPEIKPVDGNATYTAQFTSTVNKYTVSWVDGNGNMLKTEQVPYGTVPVYSGEQPTKAATVQYTYTFNNSWSPAIKAVDGNATYTAQFDAEINQYKITFVNDNGDVLESKLWDYGAMPTYSGTPSKASTAQYDFHFAAWTPNVKTVTGEATYEATYTSVLRKYTVTWWQDKDEDGVVDDGEILETDAEVPYGSGVSYDGETPEKAHDDEYYYLFAGWDPSYVEYTVQGNVTFKAQFNPVLKYFDVIWYNRDGATVLELDEDVRYGQMPQFDGTTPVWEPDPDDGWEYRFTGWTPALSPVFNSQTYVAVYERVAKTYTISYDLDDNGLTGTVSGTNPVSYKVDSDSITLVNPVPDHPWYTFTGWTGTDLTEKTMVVTIPAGSVGNREYIAHFELISYTISFDSNGGTPAALNSISYTYGETVTLPNVQKEGYTFVWNVSVHGGSWQAGETVTSGSFLEYGDVTLKAIWTPIGYTVRFHKNAADAVNTMADQAMTYDVAAKLNACTYSRTGYHFLGWALSDGGAVAFENQKEVVNLTAGAGNVVDLYAVWEINRVSLTIRTQNTVDANQTYIFTVDGIGLDGKKVHLTVAMGANDQQKIVELPAGTYTVADENGWSWRYAPQSKEQPVYHDVIVEFAYVYNQMLPERIYWLNGYDKKRFPVEQVENNG